MTEQESCLEELKEDYEIFRKKYNLPIFQQLNEDFEIEKIAQNETDYILREIRKHIMDKIIAYLRFTEMLLNPSNAPIFFFALIKGLTSGDKKLIETIYERLGSLEIDVIFLDCKYKEKEEAEFIKKAYLEWQKISEEVLELAKTLKNNWKQKSKEHYRDYFG